MSLPFLISTFGLEKSHPLRKNWRNGEYRFDPATQNVFRVVGTTILAVFATVIIAAIVVDIYTGVKILPEPESGAAVFMVSVLIMTAIVVGVLLSMYGFLSARFDTAMERLARILHAGTYELCCFPWPRLQGVANNRLYALAELVKAAEKSHHEDPYHEERLKTKREFETTYDFFVSLGLIEGGGYGKFFARKVS